MQGAQSASRLRGIGRYASSLVRAILSQAEDHEIILALNEMLPEGISQIQKDFSGLIPRENIVSWRGVGPVARHDISNDVRFKASAIIRESFLTSFNPDHILETSFFEGYVDNAVTSLDRLHPSAPTSIIAYDLVPALNPKHYLLDPTYRRFYEEKLAQFSRADHFLTISKSTRDELQSVLSVPYSKSTVIHAGSAECFNAINFAKAPRNLGGKLGNYILYPGGFDQRKNLRRLIEAFSQLPPHLKTIYKLVIAGSATLSERSLVLEMCAAANLPEERISFTGFLSDEDWVSIYCCAALVVFPSWHEGFGLPILEAARCGVPVICGDAPGSREVIGHPDATFDPFNTLAIRNHIDRTLSDKGFRSEMISIAKTASDRYSWAKTAKIALDAITSVGAQTKTFANSTRKRMAYVSPLPPAQTGIADYSAQLIPSLAKYYNIDCVVADRDVDPSVFERSASLIDIETFRKTASQYDRILYHFGNSPFHAHMYELLGLFPGVVCMHDQFNGSFLSYAEKHLGWQNVFWKALYDSHGWPSVLFRAQHGDDRAADLFPASRWIVDSSIGIITHSYSAQTKSEAAYGIESAGRWGVSPFPRLSRSIDPTDKIRSSSKSNKMVRFSTFGFIDDTKCALELIDAWYQTPMAIDPMAELVFVGANHGGAFGQLIKQRIHDTGLESSIRITGFLNEQDYASALDETDIAIQLRKVSRGETSAALFDCLVSGIPTIVNDIGAFSELPEGVAHRIPSEPTVSNIAEAMTYLYQSPKSRQQMGLQAKNYANSAHTPDITAESMYDLIEGFYNKGGNFSPLLVQELAATEYSQRLLDPDLSIPLANAIVFTSASTHHQRTIYVDVSALVATDRMTGIERTALNILRNLLQNDYASWRIEPVYATVNEPYRRASNFVSQLFGIPITAIPEENITPRSGDIILVLDWEPAVAEARKQDLETFQEKGVSIYFTVYDLLPYQRPDWFPDYVGKVYRDWLSLVAMSDAAICISKSVANELQSVVDILGPEELRRPRLGWFHLGSDLRTIPADDLMIPDVVDGEKFILAVGTVEPRKGYHQLLTVLERLWSEGDETVLVIVGKKGWMVDELADRLEKVSAGNPRLIWLKSADDKVLTNLYSRAEGLVMASEGEGFGLPLVEIAQFNKPIFARDLPVFREICGRNATFFQDIDFERNLKCWLASVYNGTAVTSKNILSPSWSDSAATLMEMIGEFDHANWLPH